MLESAGWVQPGESFYHAPRQSVPSLARGYGWGDAGGGADRAWKESDVRISGAATIEQYIVFVGIRYKHVRCTNSKLRVLYTHDPPAK